MRLHSALAATVCLLFMALSAHADTANDEIVYLLDAIGTSGCTFVRNGKSHSAEEARSHLSMKYRRGSKYAGSAEKFIERLASKSSFSGKPYYMECEGEPRQEAGVWLSEQLAAYRGA